MCELQITGVIIAHCLETIAAADRVPRLESGRVLGSEAAEPAATGSGGVVETTETPLCLARRQRETPAPYIAQYPAA